MNHDQEKNPADGPAPGPAIDPALEARVVAWVAGEASAFEAAELERLVAAQPELEIFRRRMAFMHRLVNEAAKPDAAPQRLAPERRAALLATLGGTASAAAETPAAGPLELPLLGARQKGWRLHRWLAAGTAAAACLAVSLVVWNSQVTFNGSHKEARAVAASQEVAEMKRRAENKDRESATKRQVERDAEEKQKAGDLVAGAAPALAIQMPVLEPRTEENDPVNVANRQSLLARADHQLAAPALRRAVGSAPKNESSATEPAHRTVVSFSGGGITVDDPTKDFPPTSGGVFYDRALRPSSASATTITTADRSALVWGSGNFNVATSELFNFQTPIGGAVPNKVGGDASGPALAPRSNELSSGGRVFALANGSITVKGGANINTQGPFLSTLSETGDFAFSTSTPGGLPLAKADGSAQQGRTLTVGGASVRTVTMPAGSNGTLTYAGVTGEMIDAGLGGARTVSLGGKEGQSPVHVFSSGPTGNITLGTSSAGGVALNAPAGTVSPSGNVAYAATAGNLIIGTGNARKFVGTPSGSVPQTGATITTGGGLATQPSPPAQPAAGDIVKLDAFVVSTDRDVGYAAASTLSASRGVDALFGAIVPRDQPAQTGGSDLAFLRGDVITVASAKPVESFAPASDAVTLSAFTVSSDATPRARREAPALAKAKAEEDKPVARPAPQRVVPPADVETTAAREPASTFSLHVGDVSFRLAQAALMRGERPDPARIRAEEFYNTFDYADPAPSGAEKIASRIEQAAHPVLPQRNLVRIAVKVGATGRAAQVPLRLTVLLDTSGSMEREDRSATVRRALASLTALLGPADRVTLIGFARTPRLLAEALPGDKARSLTRLVAGVPAEGGTNLEEALKLAGDLARRHRTEGAQNRIVLLTDGAANLGAAVPAQLTTLIAGLRREGIALDACGVGLDGLDDEMLEALTRQGDGRYTVLNTPEDADAEFAKKLAGAFRPAAENVKLQVRFNPARVGAYRLVGFESRRMSAEDFRNDAVDAAELAAEEAAVALYQVEVLPQGEGEVGEVFVRFRDPAAGGAMVERSWPIVHEPRAPSFARASPTLKLAAVSALLAEKLRGGTLAGQFKLGDLTPTMNMLRVHYAGVSRVEELARMFTQARQLTRE